MCILMQMTKFCDVAESLSLLSDVTSCTTDCHFQRMPLILRTILTSHHPQRLGDAIKEPVDSVLSGTCIKET